VNPCAVTTFVGSFDVDPISTTIKSPSVASSSLTKMPDQESTTYSDGFILCGERSFIMLSGNDLGFISIDEIDSQMSLNVQTDNPDDLG
jgi:hypothetical protein